ncbi:hypothetical protein SNE40_003172 [Patella caerulea]|uniref:G-protein coupled receptors family 2 profile 2 domain-containing protein n=1 Tax=Patella caerulea TaxID=87958 RepID=A0AAN8KFM0_PATCE
MYTKRDNYVFTTNDRCQDNEKFDDIFQKCRRFFCPPGRFHYEGDCHDTNTTVYVTGKSQPLANGTNDLYISMNYRQLTRASLSEHSLESIICLLSSYLRLTETYIQIPTYVSRIQKTAVIVYDITASSIKYFLDAVDSLPLSFSSFEISLSITNFDEQGKYNFSCSRGTFACIRNASLKVQNEIIFAEVNVNNITLFYPLANTIINLRISSRNPVIIAEELCVCVPQFGTSLNCTSRLYSYQPNEYLLKESGILDIPKLGISFTSLEYYIEDSQAIVCYDLTKFKHFFDMDRAQTYLSWVCSGLSIFFLLITISLYATIAELRNLPGKLTIGLAVTLILGQGLLMIPNVGVKVCRYLATISHISWLSAFLWMSAQAVNMLFTFHPKSMRVVSQRGSDAFMKYCLFCVLTPVVFCIMLLVLDVIPGNHLHVRYGMAACSWMSDYSGYIFTFFLPVALVLGCNLVCFVVTLYYIEKTMKQSAKMTGKKRDRDRCVIYIKLSSVMGFSWIFGFIASYTNVQALWYVYIILNGLQGMFIFLSFSVNTRTRGLLTQRISASRFFNVFRSSDPPPTSTTATALSTHL